MASRIFQCHYYDYPFHKKLYEYLFALITKQVYKFSKPVKNNS